MEGGVGGYVFGVTGEGCGCVSMNVSGDTTRVTCSGWTAAGQTCSFEVRTHSQDCGFTSDPVNESITLAGEEVNLIHILFLRMAESMLLCNLQFLHLQLISL